MSDISVAVAGFGAIGKKVAEALDQGIPGLKLVAVAEADAARAEAILKGFKHPVPVVPLQKLAEMAEVIAESLPASIFRKVAEPALQKGRKLVALSVGALAANMDLVDLARAHGGQIIVPSGALLGLDGLVAASQETIHSVKLVSKKPPGGLVGAPYLVQNKIDLTGIKEPVRVFAGTAREAAAAFPANVNVGAALGLAGIGVDRTMVEIWADPTLTRNTHQVEVDSESAILNFKIENLPAVENPRTSRIAALSVIATLKNLVSPLKIG